MLILSLLGCLLDPKLEPDTQPLTLDDIDAGDGSGAGVGEFAEAELTLTLALDWSFANLPGLEDDVVDVTADQVDATGDCVVDDGTPVSCSFDVTGSVTSSSGLWEFQDTNTVEWVPGRLIFSLNGNPELSAEAAAAIATGVADDGIVFSDTTLDISVSRGADGAGQGLPVDSDIDVVVVSGRDDTAGTEVLFAADDTID